MKTRKTFYSIGILVVLSLLSLSGCGPIGQYIVENVPSLTGVAAAQEAPQVESPALTTAETNSVPATSFTQGTVLSELEAALNGIYETVNPSVVSVQVTQKVSATMQQLPFYGMTPQTPEDQYQQGAGSGFVWDTQGHIVTNYHVVENADKVRVIFSEGTNVLAEVVGTDPDSDLAVLKVDVPAEQLHPVTLADSKQVQVGQLAVAIGNPFALGNTMTVGFISAIGRSLPAQSTSTSSGTSYTIPDIIQTDAPINPGNSGGVLVNEKGEVVGVPSAIISPVGASAGIGFAIPSAIVEEVVPALIGGGNYTHAWLGISGTTLTPEVAQAMDLDENQRGALVISVQENSPASEAGLIGSDSEITVDGQSLPTGGDVIIAFAGDTVNTFDDLVANLARFSAGETVRLTVIRDGTTREIKVTLGERPTSTAIVPVTPQQDESSAPQQQEEPSTSQVTTWLGIMAMSMNPQLAEAMDLSTDQQGVLVGQIQSGSPADKAGLRGSDKAVTLNGQEFAVGGDVIIAWNGEAIASMPELQAHVRSSQPGDEVTLTIIREGKERQIEVTLEARP